MRVFIPLPPCKKCLNIIKQPTFCSPLLEIGKDKKKYLYSSFIAIIDFEIKCRNKLDFKPNSEFAKEINKFI